MTAICIIFQVHQPLPLRTYDFFEIGHQHDYFESKSEKIEKYLRDVCLPVNEMLQKLNKKTAGKAKFALSISGSLLDQMEEQAPKVLDSFTKLVTNNSVELLCQTYYHSQSFLYSRTEFIRQVEKHRARLGNLFNASPQVFNNTEKFFGNDIAKTVEELGFQGVVSEGSDAILTGRSPNHVYIPLGTRKIRTLIPHQELMDTIRFRSADATGPEYPLTTAKVTQRLLHLADKGDSAIHLVLNYNIFEQASLLSWFEKLIVEILSHDQLTYELPSDVIKDFPVKGTVDATHSANWSETGKDLPAGIENYLQREALERVYRLETSVLASKDPLLLNEWSNLLSADHFAGMGNGLNTRYDTYINYLNVLTDLEQRLL